MDASDRFLFRLYREYYRVHHGMLPIQFIGKRLEAEPAEVAQRIASRFTELRDHVVDDHVFEWAFTSSFEAWRDDEARSVLYRAVKILSGSGAVDGEGDEAHAVRGYQAMRDAIGTGFARIDQQMVGSVPERELADAEEAILSAVGSAQSEARFHFPSGIDVLDNAMPYGGLASGQLWFIAGYAGTGKTTFCTSVLTHSAIMRGLNVLYLTGETLLDEVELKLVARHAREPQFGLPGGVDLMSIRKPDGLRPDELDGFHAAVNDLTTRTGLDYGRAVVRQMPMRNTVDDVLETLERFEAQWPVHVLVVDSIDMVKSSSAGRNDLRRDQLAATIEDFANLAVAYANGRGLIVISPYQIHRDAYNRAIENNGRYELSALAETAMAERRASVVLSLLALSDSPGQLRAQVLKNRYGPTPEFPIEVDFRTAFMGAAAGVVASATDLVY